ncbi:hypothetical protein EVAR_101327_1, partial [Eumeta japonica]
MLKLSSQAFPPLKIRPPLQTETFLGLYPEGEHQ